MVDRDKQYAIETFSLTKIFPDWWGRAKVVAVEDLNLQIKNNEVYGLLGPNGSGKTTTLKVLLSLLHPSKGKALVLGGSSSDTRISARVGYLPEESYLYKYLSARETLDFYGRIFGLPRSVRKARIESLLDMVGLSGMANRQVGTFSKGMARRIGLAQALINDPDVLILDEPTSGMDPIGTRQMKDIIIQLAKRGKTILLCSHLLADVEDVCDRIGILFGGRMREEGKVTSLLQKRDEKQIVTGHISEEALEKIRKIVAGENSPCEITSPMDKLEQFFIRTVAEAQKQQVSTSGAVNTGAIGGFLAEEAEKESVLDKLVSSKVEPEVEAKADKTEPATIETVEVGGVKEIDAGAKSDLLSKLTGKTAGPIVTEKVSGSKPVETKVEKSEGVRGDVLKDLMGGGSGDTERTGKSGSGEDKDA